MYDAFDLGDQFLSLALIDRSNAIYLTLVTIRVRQSEEFLSITLNWLGLIFTHHNLRRRDADYLVILTVYYSLKAEFHKIYIGEVYKSGILILIGLYDHKMPSTGIHFFSIDGF